MSTAAGTGRAGGATVRHLRKAAAYCSAVCSVFRDFLYPPLCLVCNNPFHGRDLWLCSACFKQLDEIHAARDPCPRCSQNRKLLACGCDTAWDHTFEQACSIFDFDGIVQHIIHHVKYKGKKDLARYIGSRYANRIPETFFWGMDVITPVPLHYFRRLKRGYNQARYLALGIMEGSAVNAAYCEDILRRVKHTRTQTKLEREARRKNLARAFTINRDRTGVVRGKGVLLVDDVVTTGATADLCAQVLLDAGAARVRVLSLART